MPLPIIYSLIFYFAFIGYTFLGFYILFKDNSQERKLTFLGLCLSLGIWSFSFSIANSAQTMETALIWRRVAAFGWGSMYSFLLHFTLVLTNQAKKLRATPLLLLLYLPALIIIVFFALYQPSALNQYMLILSPSGWVNHSQNNGLDIFFNLYYLTYSFLSLLLFLITGIRETGKTRRALLLIFATFLFALILGSHTDIIFNSISHEATPQLAVAIILIPVSAILFSVKHYDLMTVEKKKITVKDGEILNQYTHRTIYRYLMIAYLIGANTNFISAYFLMGFPLWQALLPSVLLLIMGMAILLIQASSIKDADKDLLLIAILSMSIPFVLFYYQAFAGVTVWAAPIVFIILLIPFRNEKYLILVGAFYLISLVLLWMATPVMLIKIIPSNHLNRIIFVLLFLSVAIYVNRIFLKRLRENEEQIRLQKLISDISSDLINISEENQEHKVISLLKRYSDFLKSDRLCLRFFDSAEVVAKEYQWHRQDVLSDCSDPTWLIPLILKDRSIFAPDAAESQYLLSPELKSFYVAPVSSYKNIGALQVEYLNEKVIWHDSQVNSIKIISNLLIDAFNKLESEESIRHMAYFDALTGLPNRVLYNEQLSMEIHEAIIKRASVAVVFLDIDGFKAINDTLGHNVGDQLLIEVGHRLSKKVRRNDIVSRFGGDEFLIMLSEIYDLNDLDHIIDNIMSVFSAPINLGGQELYITVSIGVSLYPEDGEDPDTLIKNADLSMYHSKDFGKNQVTVCSPDLKEDLKLKTRLTNDLYRAIEREELELYYQPQVSLETMEINGIEALIRWNHPEMGLMSPGLFIPLAMKHPGLMKPIDRWVIETACRQLKNWQELCFQLVPVAVNLSSEQLENVELIEIIRNNLAGNDILPELLELEITETLAFTSDQETISVLNGLKELGVTIAIDDFGVEYSSLNRIKNLPFDRIKMDIAFIRELDENPKNRPIAKTIIQLAKILNLKVLAEGVETAEQLAFLKESGCDEVQGYYFYRPMKVAEVTRLLKKE
ncbi:EAL domain-containing protein [Eubacteriaceae bacterium ES3]|nr:EAL domain-containing protein [Eubacteriaceae bacterium ES3]